MLQNRLGVSPPQAGKTQDSKVANNKDFLGVAKEEKTQYKTDFESALSKKLQKQKSDQEKKNELAKQNELRAERKEKKSSGGTKKKMTDVDDKMVSNGMASKENEVETPVPKEESAKIEINNKQTAETNLIDAVDATAAADANSVEQALQQQPQQMQTADAAELTAQAKAGVANEGQVIQQPESVEQELSRLSAYKSDVKPLAGSQDLADKLQGAAEAKQNSVEAQAFEKNVLAQLQKESGFNSSTSSEQNKDGGLDQKGQSDLTSDFSGNQLHQATGQTHGEFKAHMGAASAASSTDSSLAKLEENREGNISQLMNQAQYLVKKGGGEVTVKMSPEGLGEVNLKVHLLDGKLNIEMQTTDNNVKKLIEESLSDLKSGLAAQRLSLEHVKIDTVNATNTDNNAQMQSNLNQGGSEGQAREFFREFQNGSTNQNSRERSASFTNSSSQPRISTSTASRSSTAQALRTYGGTKGATINRVA